MTDAVKARRAEILKAVMDLGIARKDLQVGVRRTRIQVIGIGREANDRINDSRALLEAAGFQILDFPETNYTYITGRPFPLVWCPLPK